MEGHDCLKCGVPLRPYARGGTTGRVVCRDCWTRFRDNYSRNISRLDVIADLFDAHWIALGLQQAAA